MNENELYYTAGLIDGEGTITLIVHGKGQRRSPSVTITSTTPELLTYLKDTFGGFISTQKIYKEHHKQSWAWKIDQRRAVGFCSIIWPYLKEPKKQKRAKLIAERYIPVTPRNGKYTKKMLVEKSLFEEEFFSY